MSGRNRNRNREGALGLLVLPAKPTVTTQSLPAGEHGEAYDQTLAVTGAAGGTWSISAGEASFTARGFSLNTSTGQITGSATSGLASFTVQYTDPYDQIGTKALTIGVPPKITTIALDDADEGVPYSMDIETTDPECVISMIGDLHDGLTFTDNEDGTATIAGTPTEVMTAALTITAEGAGGEDEAELNLTVIAGFELESWLTDSGAKAYFEYGDDSTLTKDGSHNVSNIANRMATDVQLVLQAGTAGVWSADCKGTGVGGIDISAARYYARNEANSAAVNIDALITAATYVIGVCYYADAGISDANKRHGTLLSTTGANNHLAMTVVNDGGVKHVNHARVASLDNIYNEVTVTLSSLRVVLAKKVGGQLYTSLDGGAWSTPTAGGDLQNIAVQLYVGTSGVSPGFQYFDGGIFRKFFLDTVPADLDDQLANIDTQMREAA